MAELWVYLQPSDNPRPLRGAPAFIWDWRLNYLATRFFRLGIQFVLDQLHSSRSQTMLVWCVKMLTQACWRIVYVFLSVCQDLMLLCLGMEGPDGVRMSWHLRVLTVLCFEAFHSNLQSLGLLQGSYISVNPPYFLWLGLLRLGSSSVEGIIYGDIRMGWGIPLVPLALCRRRTIFTSNHFLPKNKNWQARL